MAHKPQFRESQIASELVFGLFCLRGSTGMSSEGIYSELTPGLRYHGSDTSWTSLYSH